ncbi:MAG: hypothetical protein ACYS26_10425 [Planctomycetota bacterium]|jgi:hypothetical protein
MKRALFAGLGVTSTLTLSAGPEMVFAVEAGAKHQKIYAHTLQIEVESGLMRMGDDEQEMPDEFSLELNHDVTRAFIDHYVACEGGRPTHLVRTLTEFDDIASGLISEGPGDDHIPEIVMDSELEGAPLRWKWSDGGYEVRPAEEDSDLDLDLLAGLDFDLDGLALLPEEGTDVTSGWEIEGAALLGLLNPGGDIWCLPSEAFEDDEDAIFRILALLPALGELEGDVELRPAGKDGVTFEVTGELSATIDAWPFVERWAQGSDDPMFDEVTSLELGTELELDGTLTWDPELGCLAGFELSAGVERTLNITGEQGEMSMELEMLFTGEAEWSLEVEPVRG